MRLAASLHNRTAIGRVTGDVTGVWWAFVIAELVSLTASALYLRRVNRDVIRTL